MNLIELQGRALLNPGQRTETPDRTAASEYLPPADRATLSGVRSRSATFSATLTPQIPRPTPAPIQERSQIVGDQTRLADLVQHFGNTDGKRLRLTPQADGTLEMHTLRSGAIHNPFTAGAKHRAAYDFMLAAVTRELGGNDEMARRILDNHGCSRRDGVRTICLPGILQDVKIVNIRAARTQAATPAAAQARAEAATQFLQPSQGEGIEALIPREGSARLSDAGMSGALLVRNAQEELVAVIKPDTAATHDKAQFIAAVTAPFREAGAMLGFPASERVTLTPAQAAEMKVLLGPPSPGSVHDRVGRAHQNIDNTGQVTRMQPVKGRDLSKLPAEECIDLIRSGVLGRDVGYAAVQSLLSGLSDHMSLVGANPNRDWANWDNFILGEDGMLHAVDPAAVNREGVMGPKPAEMLQVIADIRTLFEAANQAASPGEYIDQLIVRIQSRASNSGPLAAIIDSILSPGPGGLFRKQADLNKLTVEDKRMLVTSMMHGLLQGLEFAQQGAVLAAGYNNVAASGLQHHFGADPAAFFTPPDGEFQTAVQSVLAQKASFETHLADMS